MRKATKRTEPKQADLTIEERTRRLVEAKDHALQTLRNIMAHELDPNARVQAANLILSCRTIEGL